MSNIEGSMKQNYKSGLEQTQTNNSQVNSNSIAIVIYTIMG